MFFDTLYSLARIAVVGPLAYVWLVLVLRITGKRTLAQLNAFDFIVTVALGSTLATVVLSSDVTWSDGALALALLAVLQLVVAWTSVRVPWLRQSLTSRPRLLLVDGKPLLDTLQRERISEQSLRQALRSAGVGGLEMAGAVVLETNGQLSVIRAADVGSGTTMDDLDGYGTNSDA